MLVYYKDNKLGKVREWFKRPAWKADESKISVGSNPILSAQ